MNNAEEFKVTRQILRLGNLLLNSRQEELTKYNLTFVQAESIVYFENNIGKRTQDLKKYLNVSHQAASKIIDKLIKKRYVYTQTSKEDGRAKEIYLTVEGKKICKEFEEFGIYDSMKILKDIPIEEIEIISDCLGKMIINMEKE